MHFWSLAVSATVLQAVNLGLPLLFTLALVKIYALEEFGLYSTLFSIVAILSALAEYGLPTHGLSKIQALRDPTAKAKMFVAITQTKLVTSSLTFPIYLMVASFLIGSRLSVVGILCGYPYILGVALNSSWFLYAESKLPALLVSSLTIRTGSIIVLLLVSRFANNIEVAIALNSISFLLVGFWSTWIGLRVSQRTFKNLLDFSHTHREIKENLKQSGPLSLSNIFVVFYTSINVILVSNVISIAAAGIIGVAERVVRAGQTILSGMTTAGLASASRHTDRERRTVLGWQITMHALSGVLVYLSSSLIVRALGTNLDPLAIDVLRIYSWVLAIGGVSSVLNTHYFVRTGKYRIQTIIVFGGCLLNVPLVYILAVRFGTLGAAAGVAAVETLVLSLTLAFAAMHRSAPDER